MQTIYGVTSGENIVQAFTEENTTEANFHQSINNAAILTFTTTEPLKDGVRFFLTKDPINDYKHEEFMYFEITDQDFDGYEYTYRAEEYAYHDLDTMGYVKKVYNQGKWTTKSLLESITYNDVEPKGIARTKWEIIDNGITLPTTWAGEGNTYTLWYNTPLRGIEKFIEYFGGEIRFYVTIVDNKISRHYLELYLQRGRQTGKRYESNSNLISLTNKAEYSDRYEYIIPLAEGGGTSGDEQKNNTPNGFNNYITLEGLEVGKSTDKWYKPKSQLYVSLANDKNAYPLKSQPKGLQNNPRIKPVTFDEVKSKEALFDKAIEWLENNQGVAWSYYASVLDIGESQVGDTIAIIDERSGISSYVRVHDIDYDMIDPENTGVHFGSNWGYENDEAITDMVNTATSVKNDLTGIIDTAVRQSNGKNTNYYGENEPTDPINGDLWYWEKGDESGIKIYQDGNWVPLVDSDTLKHINKQVDNAISEAKTYSDSLSAKQASEAAVFQSEANKALSSAAAVAQNAANSAADEGRNAAQQAAQSATRALSDAQIDLNNNIALAKSEAIEAAKYADGLIHQEVTSTASSITETISQNKSEADGKISTAETVATKALNGLSAKVNQTDYNQKTGDLDNKVGSAAITADSAALSIKNYQSTADGNFKSQSAAIEANSNAIKSKVSQSDYDNNNRQIGKLFTEFSQRADGFDLTTKKVDGLSVGGRNYVLNSSCLNIQDAQHKPVLIGLIANVMSANLTYKADGLLITNNQSNSREWGYQLATAWQDITKTPLKGGIKYTLSVEAKGTAKQVILRQGSRNEHNYEMFNYTNINNDTWTKASYTFSFTNNPKDIYLRIQGGVNNNYAAGFVGGETLQIRNIKLEEGTLATDWTPAQEDTDNALAVQQAAIKANAEAIEITASKTDLDTAKNEYTQKFADVNTQADKITDSVTALKGQINNFGQINQLFNTEFSPDKQGWYLGVPSQTKFTDPGTPLDSAAGYSVQGAAYGSSNALRMNLGTSTHSFHQDLVPLYENSNVSASVRFYSVGVNSIVSAAIYLFYYDANKNYVGRDLVNSGVSVSQWLQITMTAKAPKNTRYVSFCIMTNGSVGFTLYAQPMMVFDTKIGTYVQGSYNNNSLIQSVRTQLSDSITQQISNLTTGDNSLLVQTDRMIASQISDNNIGIMTTFASTANGILASVGNNNLVPNSEFQPTNVGWRKFTNTLGSSWGDVINLTGTKSFVDWPEKGSSNGISYHDTQWIISEPAAVNGSVMSASIVAGRTGTDNNITQALDVRIAYYDSNKKMIGSHSFGNPIDGKDYKGLKTYKLENVTPTAGTRYAGLVIAHSGPATDYIYQPMLNFGSKALKYSPTYGTNSSNAVLQLFNDNFALGILDNTKNIITGINGDSSGFVITGKKIMINGDTWFDGNNFMSAAIIKDGTIGTAKIADLAVTSAKISDLNVDKLTGNVSSFVKSKWESAYSNVAIDSSGMVVSTDESSMVISDTGFTVTTGRSVTELSDGKIDYTSDTAERIGYTGWLRNENTSVDYLSIILKGWHTTKKDDMFWNGGGKHFYGGDGIKFGITNSNYGITDLLVWNSQYASSQTDYPQGWVMLDNLQHFGNEEKYGNLNLHGHFDVPGSYQAIKFEPIMYNNTMYPAIVGTDRGGAGGAILFGSEEIYLKKGNTVVPLSGIARKAGYNI